MVASKIYNQFVAFGCLVVLVTSFMSQPSTAQASYRLNNDVGALFDAIEFDRAVNGPDEFDDHIYSTLFENDNDSMEMAEDVVDNLDKKRAAQEENIIMRKRRQADYDDDDDDDDDGDGDAQKAIELEQFLIDGTGIEKRGFHPITVDKSHRFPGAGRRFVLPSVCFYLVVLV